MSSNIKLPVQIIPRQYVLHNLQITYPVLVSGTSAKVLNQINNAIFNLVNNITIQQGYFQEPALINVLGDFEIKTNERGILSLSIINYAYRFQAAHGMTIIKSLTFDIETGQSYQLNELFKPESDYLNILSEMVKKQVEERDLPIIDGFKPVRPDQDYYIADKALVIYYQLYEMTPYAYGFPYFPISVYDIQDIILEDGPLGRMLG